jgi:LmbE family N-acetylglucosaminyl deacetylase
MGGSVILRANPRLCLTLVVVSLGAFACRGQERQLSSPSVSAFVVAHPDDWQLFMGDVAFDQVSTGQTVVFLYLTSGGADRRDEYWRARERGANASTFAAANWRQQTPAEGANSECAAARVSEHEVVRCTYRNTRSVFLRLPDGDFKGSGFAQTRSQALAKLHSANGARLDTVDSSTVYVSWADLRTTVQTLLASELADAAGGARTIHTHDPDAGHNPDDHSDHTFTGNLVREIAAALGAEVTYYAGYDIANRPANLTVDRVMSKSAVFLAYERQILLANRGWSAYQSAPAEYSAWLFRTYRRTGGTE